MGMDGKTFGSAQEFKEQLTHNTRMMKNASYREFQAGKYEGVMTPSQRTQFERQIRTREAWKEVGAGLGKAAGIGAAAAVAVGSGMIAGLGGDSDFGAVSAQASFGKNSITFSEYGAKFGGFVGEKISNPISDTIEAVPENDRRYAEGLPVRVPEKIKK